MSAYRAFLKCLALAVVAKAPRALAGLVPFGEVAYDIAAETLDRWRHLEPRQGVGTPLQAVAAAGKSELKREVDAVLAEVGAGQSPEAREKLAAYLNQVPGTVRASLRHGGTTPADAAGLAAFLPARLPHFKPGDRPAGFADWELVELLGVGGFGEVWKARNTHLPSAAPVALKFCTDPAAGRLLRHEAIMLDRLMSHGRHPGIVPLLDTSLSAEPPGLKYEFVEGGDLLALLDGRSGGMAPETATRLVRECARIVGHAHQKGIVHRDLKPANILVQSQPNNKFSVRITDFGIGAVSSHVALAAERGRTLPSLLRAAHTPLYASPQQQRGDAPGPRDDVYALGVMWYQLLTGDLTAGAPTGLGWPSELRKKGVPEPHVQLLGACLESDPSRRPADAAALAEQLERTPAVPVGVPVATPRRPVRSRDIASLPEVSRAEPPQDRPRKSGVPLVLLVGVILAMPIVGVVLIGGFYWWRADNAGSPAQTAAFPGLPGRNSLSPWTSQGGPPNQRSFSTYRGSSPTYRGSSPTYQFPTRKGAASPPAASPQERPSMVRTPIGDGLASPLLLVRTGDKPWKSFGSRPVWSGDSYLAPAGCEADLDLTGGVRLKLCGKLPDRPDLPLLESEVALHAPAPGRAAELTLEIGRVVLTNEKSPGRVDVRVRVRSQVWDVTLDPKARVVIDLLSDYPAGRAIRSQAGDARPIATATVGVLNGLAWIHTSNERIDLKAPPGPAKVTWNSAQGTFDGPIRLEAIPDVWAVQPPSDPAKAKAHVAAAAALAGRIRSEESVEAVVLADEAFNAPPAEQNLRLLWAAALDSPGPLWEALADPGRPNRRETALIALRRWIGRDPERGPRFEQLLRKTGGLGDADVAAVLDLLRVRSSFEVRQRKTYETLVRYLGHSHLAVREMASYHLRLLDPVGAKKTRYDPAAPGEELVRGLASWEDRLNLGHLPPK